MYLFHSYNYSTAVSLIMPLVCTASSGEEDTSFHLLPPVIQVYTRKLFGGKAVVFASVFAIMVVVF